MRALQDDGRVWVAPATIDGKIGLRPCFVNFRTTDDDVRALVDISGELGARLATEAGPTQPVLNHGQHGIHRATPITVA